MKHTHAIRICALCRKEYRPSAWMDRERASKQTYCSRSCSLVAKPRGNPAPIESVIDGIQHRKCRRCGVFMVLAECFRQSKLCPGGRHTQCKECDRAYRIANRELIQASGVRSYERLKATYEADPSRHDADKSVARVRRKAHYEKNLERLREEARLRARRPEEKRRRAEYRKKNRGRYAQYKRESYERNPAPHIAISQLGRARRAAAVIQDVTAAMLNERARVFGHVCAYCGGPHEHWDHVIPVSRGGKHCLANLRPACASCNLSKGKKTLREWRSKE